MNQGIIEVKTAKRNEFIDITERVNAFIARTGLTSGICNIFIPHTTAGVTVNEGHDPDVTLDLLDAFARLAPQDPEYRHVEGNSDAHMKTCLVGCSLSLPVRDGRLWLGTWQRVFFSEFDGPRSRKVLLTLL